MSISARGLNRGWPRRLNLPVADSRVASPAGFGFNELLTKKKCNEKDRSMSRTARDRAENGMRTSNATQYRYRPDGYGTAGAPGISTGGGATAAALRATHPPCNISPDAVSSRLGGDYANAELRRCAGIEHIGCMIVPLQRFLDRYSRWRSEK